MSLLQLCGHKCSWGPLHGGANQAVLEVAAIQRTEEIIRYEKAKDKNDPSD